MNQVVILVPTDGSEGANKALHYAVETVRNTNGKILLLNVQPNYFTPNVKMFFNKKAVEEYTELMASEALEAPKKILEESGVPYEIKVRVGISKSVICQEARESEVHSIVMGYRGMGAVLGTVMGSVCFAVLQETPCPITIVP